MYFRLASVKRELKVKEMHLQDATRRRFLKMQQDQREMELRRLDDEIERKVYNPCRVLLLTQGLHSLHLLSCLPRQGPRWNSQGTPTRLSLSSSLSNFTDS